jgi:hypothetical protein
MVYKIIAFLIISGIAAIKRPIFGGLAGMIAAPGIYVVFNSFDLTTVCVLSVFGFGFGLMWGTLAWRLVHAEGYNRQGKKPYVMPMSRAGTNLRGEIIYTDEEEKNAKENKRAHERHNKTDR